MKNKLMVVWRLRSWLDLSLSERPGSGDRYPNLKIRFWGGVQCRCVL